MPHPTACRLALPLATLLVSTALAHGESASFNSK
jgi:hypothetical protein